MQKIIGMTKTTTSKMATDRNPLSIALGSYFSAEKFRFGSDTKSSSIAKKLEIGESLYRMIESGNARVHPKNAFKFIEVFNVNQIHFDALCKLLFAIQFIDAQMSTVAEFENAIKILKEKTDEKLSTLLEELSPIIEAVKIDEAAIKKACDDSRVVAAVGNFLSSNPTYSFTPKNAQDLALNKILSQLPTLYYNFIEKTIDNLLSLPMGFRKDDLWKWENLNKSKFEYLYAVIKDKSSIIDVKNFETYRYEYLWNKSFKEAHLIFVGEHNVKELKKEFSKKLKSVFPTDSDLLKDFDEVMEKVKFYSTNDQVTINKILTSPLNNKDHFIVAWIFALNTQVDVGLMANQSGENFSDFISLNFEQSQNLLNKIKEIIAN